MHWSIVYCIMCNVKCFTPICDQRECGGGGGSDDNLSCVNFTALGSALFAFKELEESGRSHQGHIKVLHVCTCVVEKKEEEKK